jgi:hypothetical protein
MTPPVIPAHFTQEVVATQRADHLYDTYIANESSGLIENMWQPTNDFRAGRLDQSEYTLVATTRACINRGMDDAHHARVMIHTNDIHYPFCPPPPPPPPEEDGWFLEGVLAVTWIVRAPVGAFFSVLLYPSEAGAAELPPAWSSGYVPYQITQHAENISGMNDIYDFMDRSDFSADLVNQSILDPILKGHFLAALENYPGDTQSMKAYVTWQLNPGPH